jgi:threonine dehydrogenase-like Zn-dependent dehydrogenase
VEGFSVGDRIYTNMPHQSAFQVCAKEVLALVPKEVPDKEASFAYIAQLGLAALQKVDFAAGETVAVIGLGPVGLACIAVVKALGGKVIAVGRGEERWSVARMLGAECAIDGTDSDANYSLEGLSSKLEVIVNTANSWSAWRTCLRMARFGTRISVLGFPGREEGPPDFNPFESASFYHKQLVVAGAGMVGNGEGPSTNARLKENMARILQMLRDKTLLLSPLVSHSISWNEIGSIYEKVIRGDKNHIGVVLDWSILG